MIAIPRSENDYRTELIKEINARLPHPYKAHNSKTVTFDKDDPRVVVLKALKREFDIVILDEAFVSEREINPDRIEFAVETKPLGSPFTGISQAEDAFTAFPILIITYATNFGDKLYKREKDSPEIRLKTLAKTLARKYVQIAEYIASDVKRIKAVDPPHKEVSEKKIISTLTDCMNRIQAQMTELPIENKSDLATRTLVMWKKYDEKDVDVSALEYNVKRAASYIIVDQLLFYNLLQKKATKYRLPPLEPINGAEDNPQMFATKYIQRAISDTGDYLPIFGIDMFELLPRSRKVIKAINEVIIKIKNLKIETQSSDFIGKIFHSMIPSEIRKSLAAYYTGSAPARLLARLTIKKGTDKVCDLACGSGTLLVESYHVLHDLLKQQHPDWTDGEIHQQLIETQIYGNDITLFASHLAAMNLASQYLDGEITKINVTATDGLQISPRHSYSTLVDFVKSTEVDTVSMDGTVRSIAYPFVNCVIMNPPFSRQTDMTDSVLGNLTKAITKWFPSKDSRKKYVDKKMGLHGYFLIHANHLIETGGTIAMVLPASTFTTDYTAKLLQFLSDKRYSIDYVIEILSKQSAFSEDATFKEFLVVLRKGGLKTNSKTLLVSIFDEFPLDTVSKIYDGIISEKESKLLTVKVIDTLKLYKSAKWTIFFSDTADFSFLNSKKLEKFNANTSDLRIISGYHGTYSDYLMLPNDEWTIMQINATTFRLDHSTIPEDDDQHSCQIPSKYLVPAIRKSGDANSLRTQPNCYVLNLPYQLPKDLVDFQRKYIHWAENQLDAMWEVARKKGHKRVPTVKKLTKKRDRKGKLINDEIPWYSHAHKNGCATKNGKLFPLYKYQPSRRRTLSPFSTTETTINHGFGYILINSDSQFYASYLNSAVFYYMALQNQQIIHIDYYKMHIGDFTNIQFPKYSAFPEDERETLIEKWQLFADLPDDHVPFLPQQFGADLVVKSKKKKNPPPVQVIPYKRLPERVALDKAWLRALGVPENTIDKTINDIYNWLIEYMKTR